MADRPYLPYLDITNLQGLFTKSSVEVIQAEQLRVANNCDFFETYGALAKIKGSKRILSSQYTENSTAQPISWIGFYKAPGLDGTILRHVLVAAGTTLARIESDGSLTTLATGRTSNLFATDDVLERFMFITNQDVDRTGVGDELVKYDGSVITKWGLTPPGSQETVREAFNDATNFPNYGSSTVTDQVSTNTSHVTYDGDAIRIDKAGTSSPRFFVDRFFYPPFSVIGDNRDIQDAIPNRVSFQNFIARGSLTATNLDTTAGFTQSGRNPMMSVFVSKSSIDEQFWQFYFPIGNFVEGWNNVDLDFTTGAPGSADTAPLGNSLGVFYPGGETVHQMRWLYRAKQASTSISGVRLDRLVTKDEGAPVVARDTTGDVFDEGFVYSYKVTYVSKYGNQSNSSPQSINYTIPSGGANRLVLTNIPVSSDPQVIARRIYRTVANGSIWLFVDDILDNETTTYYDATPDGSLGVTTPPQAGDFSDDNSPPPKGGIVQVFQRTVFMAGDPQNPNILYYSEDDDPESFPLINFFELDDKITAMYPSYAGLIVETETNKWQVIGSNPDFSVNRIIPDMGCVGRRAAATARQEGYAIDRDGLRLFDLNEPAKVSEPIRDKYDSEISKTNIELIHTAHSKANNIIVQFNPDSSGEYSSIFGYIYPVDNVRLGRWTDIVPPTALDLNFLDAVEIEDSDGNFKLYTSGDDGMVYELFSNDSQDWVGADGTSSPIVTTFQTPYLRIGEAGIEVEGVGGKVQVQFVELRVKGDATTWTVTVDMADGPRQTTPSDTQDITFTFPAGESLLRLPIPGGVLTPRPYFRITATNSDAGVSSTVLGTRVYFHSRPFPGPKGA